MFIQIMPTTEAYLCVRNIQSVFAIEFNVWWNLAMTKSVGCFCDEFQSFQWAWWHSNEFQGDFIYRCVNKLTQCVVINWFSERNESRTLSPVRSIITQRIFVRWVAALNANRFASRLLSSHSMDISIRL